MSFSRTARRNAQLGRGGPTREELQMDMQMQQMEDSRITSRENSLTTRAQMALTTISQMHPNSPHYSRVCGAASEFLEALFKKSTAQVAALPEYAVVDEPEEPEEVEQIV